jgi:cytochrome b561
MRKTFTGVTALLMLAVVVQFFLAASGAFDDAPADESFGPHRGVGFLILLLALLATLAAAAAKLPGRVVGMTAAVLGLAVLQPVIAGVASALDDTGDGSGPAAVVFGLHGVNGLVIMTLVGSLLQKSREPSPAVEPGR